MRQQLLNPISLVRGKSRQHILEIRERIVLIELGRLCRLHQAHDCSRALTRAQTSVSLWQSHIPPERSDTDDRAHQEDSGHHDGVKKARRWHSAQFKAEVVA